MRMARTTRTKKTPTVSDSSKPSPAAPLLAVSQFDVDFVIPRAGVDLPLGIDPFLMFKSRSDDLQKQHALIIGAFNLAIDDLRSGHEDRVRTLLDFPEVSEIGLGYSKGNKKGAGVGRFLSELLVEALRETPALMSRGIHHIEEMQLLSVGIGPDRISDIAANLIKRFLVDYTRTQADAWGIPLQDSVPIEHVWDPVNGGWEDGYFDLPVSPIDGSPILLVPRRIVRSLPWINYDDFYRSEFSAYLRSRKVRGRVKSGSAIAPADKSHVIATTRNEVERLDRYVRLKEAAAADAHPSQQYTHDLSICNETESLKKRLDATPTGREDSAAYQRLVMEIFNCLFAPDLIDGRLEVRTEYGTERRDVVFLNDSDKTFWSYLRQEHSTLLLLLETKNTDEPQPADLNQTATYLGDRMGRLGIIVTRQPHKESHQRKMFSIYNDSNPRKIVLWLSDLDLKSMLDDICHGRDAMKSLREIYRKFRQSVQ